MSLDAEVFHLALGLSDLSSTACSWASVELLDGRSDCRATKSWQAPLTAVEAF